MKKSKSSTMKMLSDFMKFEKKIGTNKNQADLEPKLQKVALSFVQVKKKVKESKQKQASPVILSRTSQQMEKNAKVQNQSPSKIQTKINKKKNARKPKDYLEARQRKQLMKKIQSYCEEVIMNSPQNIKYFSKSIYSKIIEKISPELVLNFNLKQDQKKSIECNLLYNILRLFKWDKITNFLKKSRHKVKMLKISTFQEYILKGKMFEGQANKDQYNVTTGMLQSCLQKLRNRQYVLNELLQKKIYTKLYSYDKNQYFQKMIIFIYKIIQFTNFIQKYLDSKVGQVENKGNSQDMDEESFSKKQKNKIIIENQKSNEQEQGQESLLNKQVKIFFERNQNYQKLIEYMCQLNQYSENIQKLYLNNMIDEFDQNGEFNKQKAVSQQQLSSFDTCSCKERSNIDLGQAQMKQDQRFQSYLFDLSNDDMPYYKLLRLRSIQIEQSNTELNFLFSAKFQREELLTGFDRKDEMVRESPHIRQPKISQWQMVKQPATLP